MAELRRLLSQLRIAHPFEQALALVGDSLGECRAGSADLVAEVSLINLI